VTEQKTPVTTECVGAGGPVCGHGLVSSRIWLAGLRLRKTPKARYPPGKSNAPVQFCFRKRFLLTSLGIWRPCV